MIGNYRIKILEGIVARQIRELEASKAQVRELSRELGQEREALALAMERQVSLIADAYSKGREFGEDDRTEEHD